MRNFPETVFRNHFTSILHLVSICFAKKCEIENAKISRNKCDSCAKKQLLKFRGKNNAKISRKMRKIFKIKENYAERTKISRKITEFSKTNAKFKGKSCENSFIKDYCENTTHF